jgi:hypothetical protein
MSKVVLKFYLTGFAFRGFVPEYQGKDLWLQNTILRKTARTMMVAITPENLRKKMKMVPRWLREEPGGFARIAKSE